MTWQPIAAAPRDRAVLVGFREPGQRKRQRKPYVCEAVFYDGAWWIPEDEQDIRLAPQPTHWMPLPEPPE